MGNPASYEKINKKIKTLINMKTMTLKIQKRKKKKRESINHESIIAIV